MEATPMRYYYNYAIIDRASKMCIEIRTATNNQDNASTATELYVCVPTYSDDYLMKYYDETTGKWYYDAAMTNEWTPPTA